MSCEDRTKPNKCESSQHNAFKSENFLIINLELFSICLVVVLCIIILIASYNKNWLHQKINAKVVRLENSFKSFMDLLYIFN